MGSILVWNGLVTRVRRMGEKRRIRLALPANAHASRDGTHKPEDNDGSEQPEP